MKNFKVVGLPKADNALRGLSVPEEKQGNIGNLVQSKLIEADYPINHGKGPDIEELEVDIKTKGLESTSSWSIGSMTIEDIKSYDYDSSSLKEKCQSIYVVRHSQTFREVTETRVLDFSKKDIQEKLRYAYNSARTKIISGDRSSYIKGDNAWAYFDNKKKNGKLTNSWAFRIPVDKMKILEGMARSKLDSLLE